MDLQLPSQLPHLGSHPANWLVEVSLDAVPCLPPLPLCYSLSVPLTHTNYAQGRQICLWRHTPFFSGQRGWEIRGNAREGEQLATLSSLYRLFLSNYNGYPLFPLSALIGQIYKII